MELDKEKGPEEIQMKTDPRQEALDPSSRNSTASNKMRYLHPSPNELARLKSEHEKQKRLDRLQKVRQKERTIAAQRREAARMEYDNEWRETISKANEEWKEEHAQRIAKLSRIYETALKHQGDGHRSAESAEESKIQVRSQLRETLIERQSAEAERSLKSSGYFQRQEYQRVAPKLHKKALLSAIAKQESARAAIVVQAYKERMASTDPPIEIPSNPVYRVNQRCLTSQPNFENTYVHREFAVTRIKHEAEALTKKRESATPLQPKNVWEMAALESDRAERDMQLKQARQERLGELSKKRTDESRRVQHMHKEREMLLKSLKELQIDDRRRKQKNAGIHAKQFKGTYLNLGKEKIKQRFISHFGLEDDQNPTSFIPPISGRQPPQPKARQYYQPESSEPSFELVRNADVEIYTSSRPPNA